MALQVLDEKDGLWGPLCIRRPHFPRWGRQAGPDVMNWGCWCPETIAAVRAVLRVPLLLMDQGLPSSVRFSLNTILRSEWIYRKYKCFLKATNKMSDRKPSLSHILVHGLWVMWQLIPVTLKEGRRWHHPHLFMGVWNTRPEHDSSFGNYQLEEEADLKICHLPPGHFFCLLSSFLLRKFLPLP